MPKGKLLTKETMEKVKKLNEARLSNTEISQMLNISTKSVSKIKKYNYDYGLFYMNLNKPKKQKVEQTTLESFINQQDVEVLQLDKIIKLLQEISNKLDKRRIF